ncbi:MAG: exo-alpha-sialidase [Planctomycetes bacterium]|nr:exo-alpha-sialidase [Planctomycetota bacterium]
MLLTADLKERLIRFADALIDQRRAKVVVPPHRPAPGFWFGGGNLVEGRDGTLWLVGRYRTAGDSRTGVAAGERGLELAIFASPDRGRSFEKVLRLEKSDLDVDGRRVLSIEGSALRETSEGFELFVSTEKDGVGYPPGFEQHLKSGTGVWSIERLAAPTIEELGRATPVTVLDSRDPQFLHVKDPFVYEQPGGDLFLGFCSHPYCWTSSNTGYANRPSGRADFHPPVFSFFPRGFTWDVAITRGTCVLDLPAVGALSGHRVSLLFYDGGECVRNHEEHRAAVTRPRGYSCEELGGAACFVNGDLSRVERLSVHRPLFQSPHGTGCSRYVNVLAAEDGYYATWQQSQPDGSQALVMNVLSQQEARELLI